MIPRCLHCRRPAQCNATGKPACRDCWHRFPELFRRALVGVMCVVGGFGCLKRGREPATGVYADSFPVSRTLKAELWREVEAKAKAKEFTGDRQFLEWFNAESDAAEIAADQEAMDEMDRRIGGENWSNENLEELAGDFAAQAEAKP